VTATPGTAQEAIQDLGVQAFYQSLGVGVRINRTGIPEMNGKPLALKHRAGFNKSSHLFGYLKILRRSRSRYTTMTWNFQLMYDDRSGVEAFSSTVCSEHQVARAEAAKSEGRDYAHD
jgi:hypothetical protein